MSERIYATPTAAFRLVNDDPDNAIFPTRVYEVRHAFNQPDWEEKGLVFFPLPDGNSILINKAGYRLVQPVLVNEIAPQPKSVFEFYDGHPERWTQDCYGMVKADGMWTDRREDACKVCLGVALGLIYYRPEMPDREHLYDAAVERLFRIVHAESVRKHGYELARSDRDGTRWIIDWNDSVSRSHDEIVRVCKEARI